MRTPRSFALPDNHSLMGCYDRAVQKGNKISYRSAWPAEGIREGSTIDDYAWGYLYINQGGEVSFDASVQPTQEEILACWGHCLKRGTLK